jgi:hypothetical protein
MLCSNLKRRQILHFHDLNLAIVSQYLELLITIKTQWQEKYNSIISFSESYHLMAAFFHLEKGVDYDTMEGKMLNKINYKYTYMNLNTYKILEIYFVSYRIFKCLKFFNLEKCKNYTYYT